MKRFLFLFLLLFAAQSVLAAPVPRAQGVVEEPYVYLADLFDGIGAAENRIISAAPRPGESKTFDLATLSEIVQKYGLPLELKQLPQKAVIRRAHRQMEAEDVLPVLTGALPAYGIDPGTVELALVSRLPAVALSLQGEEALEVLSFKMEGTGTAAFEAVLGISRPQAEAVEKVQISGKVIQFAEIPVAQDVLSVGTRIARHHLVLQKVRTDKIPARAILDPEQLIGKEAKRIIRPFSTFGAEDIKNPVLVNKGKAVTVLYQSGAMSLTAMGKALDSGTSGDMVRVQNPVSKTVVQGKVLKSDTVSVSLQ